MKLILLTAGLAAVGVVSLFVPALSPAYTLLSCSLLVSVSVGGVYKLNGAEEESEEAVRERVLRSKINILQSRIIELEKNAPRRSTTRAGQGRSTGESTERASVKRSGHTADV